MRAWIYVPFLKEQAPTISIRGALSQNKITAKMTTTTPARNQYNQITES